MILTGNYRDLPSYIPRAVRGYIKEYLEESSGCSHTAIVFESPEELSAELCDEDGEYYQFEEIEFLCDWWVGLLMNNNESTTLYALPITFDPKLDEKV
jgi:hypothetical protein